MPRSPISTASSPDFRETQHYGCRHAIKSRTSSDIGPGFLDPVGPGDDELG